MNVLDGRRSVRGHARGWPLQGRDVRRHDQAEIVGDRPDIVVEDALHLGDLADALGAVEGGIIGLPQTLVGGAVPAATIVALPAVLRSWDRFAAVFGEPVSAGPAGEQARDVGPELRIGQAGW